VGAAASSDRGMDAGGFADARNRGTDGWWTEPARPRRPAPPTQVGPLPVPARDPFGGMFNWDEA
jgi:hypothetical protein